ncbi:proline and serine-rich protein 2-like [Heptranchias perlo]|uniref:proline and serine-rich protein 2-like n=1 Tax=Heptranchias perlo TaxID=212740 RepID=UPI00355A05F6
MDPEVNFAQESGRVNTEGEAATFSKEDEFLRHLSHEEKECLSFLIETIDSLEVELEEDDEEGVTKGDSIISDGFYEFLGMVCSTRQTDGTAGPDDAGSCDNVGTIRNVDTFTSSPPAEMINNRDTESVPGLYTTPNQTAASEEGMKEKEPIKHRGSETTIAFESNISNQSRDTSPDEQRSPRTLTLLPAHAKKFDTILRSGVSVQELRAQVLARLSGSGQRPSSQVAGLAAQPNSLRLLGGPEQKAARQEALQRLGLWKFTGGLSNSNSSSSQTLAMEGAQQSKSPQSPTEKDHEEALKKLGLLNL